VQPHPVLTTLQNLDHDAGRLGLHHLGPDLPDLIALAVYQLLPDQQHPYPPGWNRAAPLRLDTVLLG